MLFIFKKTTEEKPRIINPDPSDCAYLADLPSLIGVDDNQNINILTVTRDGLHAFCISKRLGEGRIKADEVNCAINVCTSSYPMSIEFAMSDVVFFRFRYGNELMDIIPFEELSAKVVKDDASGNFVFDTRDCFDSFALKSVTKADAQYIGAMLSQTRQLEYFEVARAVCTEYLKRLKLLKKKRDENNAQGKT